MEEWKSSVGVDIVTLAQRSFQELHVDGENVFWVESRPLEKGRRALIQKKGDDAFFELFPSRSIQSKIHEYGGGAFFVKKSLLIFFDIKIFSLFFQREGEDPVCLIQDPLKRWANFSLSPDLRELICVCEDHAKKDEVLNYLVIFTLSTGRQRVVHQGADFYASPQWSPDGEKIAFVSWNFPNMPWDESLLKIISSRDSKELFSLGGVDESITQFIWIAPKKIIFASDRSGFSNLYLWTPEGETLLYKKDADFSSPLWVLGKKDFEFVYLEGKECLVVNICEKAVDSLAILEIETRKLHKLEVPYTVIDTLDVGLKGIYFVGGSEVIPLSLVFLDIKTLKCEVISSSSEFPEHLVPCISKPKAVSVLSSLDHQKIFGFFYPPHNPDYEIQLLPPLIIRCHSGPTAHVQPLLNWSVQFWTSRGFAFLDVNYRGSSGFGRKYQKALNHNWGLLDVQDCLDLAQSLVEEGQVDGKALFAKGSSSGGFTALCMAAVSSKLKGCISAYGVTDLCLLTQETHKFERYYLDSLIGDSEKFAQRYISRSPIHRADQISCPTLFVHGDQDCVVPLSQAMELKKKLPLSELIVFQGEGHGFRRAETIKAYLEAELAFYKKILN